MRELNFRPITLLIALAWTILSSCVNPGTNSGYGEQRSFFRGQQETQRPESVPTTESERQPLETEILPAPNRPADPKTPTGPKLTAPSAKTESPLVLKVTVAGEKQVGSQVTFHLVLRNTGTTAVDDLVIISDFEAPLTMPGHPKSIAQRNVGTLKPGDSSKMELTLVSEKPGTFACEFSVRTGTTEQLWKSVSVRYLPKQTSIQLFLPKTRSPGERAEATLLVANVGTRDFANLKVVVSFDNSIFKTYEFSDGAKVQQETENTTLTWSWKSVKAGEGIPLQIELDCLRQSDSGCLRVSVSADDIPAVTQQQCLKIVPAHAVWEMQIGDTADFLAVGDESSVTVSLRNRGENPKRPGKLSITIPANYRVVSSVVLEEQQELKVEAKMQGNTIHFARPTELAANADLLYRVRVKSIRDGHAVFQAELFDENDKSILKRDEPTSVSR